MVSRSITSARYGQLWMWCMFHRSTSTNAVGSNGIGNVRFLGGKNSSRQGTGGSVLSL